MAYFAGPTLLQRAVTSVHCCSVQVLVHEFMMERELSGLSGNQVSNVEEPTRPNVANCGAWLPVAAQASTGCSVVCSTRYKKGGGVAGWGFSRKLTSRGANQLASTLLGGCHKSMYGQERLGVHKYLQCQVSG